MQLSIFKKDSKQNCKPFKKQLLKWIGNKQRFASEIISYFPSNIKTYYEPFLGSGAVLGTLAPEKAYCSDVFTQLIEIWECLKSNPDELNKWYKERWEYFSSTDRNEAFEKIKADYNKEPNGADLLFISRACYGGVVRFRKLDGYISTPVGVHNPVSPVSFSQRTHLWHERIVDTEFSVSDFEDAMLSAKNGDLIYCDPPYVDSQSILYGAQEFTLKRLFRVIDKCSYRGVYVVLSIDGTKKSGSKLCDINIPNGLFKREIMVNVGRSMLKRFQMNGKSLEDHEVKDRLLLNY